MGNVRKSYLYMTIFIVLLLVVNIRISAKNIDYFNGFIYFYSPTCSSCAEISPIINDFILNGNIKVIKYDISTKKGLRNFNTYCEEYSVSSTKRYAPMVIINNEVLIGKDEIISNLRDIVNIVAKFLTFLALGTILFNIISLVNINYIQMILKIIVSCIILILIILNFIDFINTRAEKYGKVKLQLPKKARKRNHKFGTIAFIYNKNSAVGNYEDGDMQTIHWLSL